MKKIIILILAISLFMCGTAYGATYWNGVDSTAVQIIHSQWGVPPAVFNLCFPGVFLPGGSVGTLGGQIQCSSAPSGPMSEGDYYLSIKPFEGIVDTALIEDGSTFYMLATGEFDPDGWEIFKFIIPLPGSNVQNLILDAAGDDFEVRFWDGYPLEGPPEPIPEFSTIGIILALVVVGIGIVLVMRRKK